MAKSNLQKVSVSTLPNGYSLDLEGQSYMYFNMMDLLAGFMVHVGLQEADYMENGNILTMLFQTMIGEEWEKNITAMRNRIRDMEEKITKTLAHLEQTASTGERLEPKVNDLNGALREMSDSIAEQKAENRKALMDVRDMCVTAQTTAKDFKKESKALKEVIDKIKKGAEDIKAMREAAEKHLKTLETPGSKTATDAPEKKKKSNGSRNKAADALVQESAKEQHLEEMEKQLQEHWKKEGAV